MSREEGPWGEREPLDDADVRELADLPSSASPWIVIALALWIALGALSAAVYLR